MTHWLSPFTHLDIITRVANAAQSTFLKILRNIEFDGSTLALEKLDSFGHLTLILISHNFTGTAVTASVQQSTVDVSKNKPSLLDLRVGPLVNIEPLLRALGHNPVVIFDTNSLDMGHFRNPDNRISFTSGADLMATCVQTTGCEHFGLLLGQWFHIWHLGIAGRLAQIAPNVGSALRDIINNLDLHDQGAVATLETGDRYSTFGYSIYLTRVTAVEQVYDLSITNMCCIMRSLCGADWNPLEVHLSRAEPKDTRPYRKFFRAPVLFNALESSVVFPNQWLRHPLTSADPQSHEHLFMDTRRQHDAMPHSLAMKVQNTLRRNLTQNTNTAAAVAKEFGLHERTLRRRLRAEGTNFRTLLDQVRQTVSLHYLASTALAINDIAEALGYASNDAFDHAFQRWFGESPSCWRTSNSAPIG